MKEKIQMIKKDLRWQLTSQNLDVEYFQETVNELKALIEHEEKEEEIRIKQNANMW